ncbi:MAG: transporter substrate-binding domain-containing protein [Deltaproteobacteria bacterium]|uniref:substrate-binding periplasmic protein n=1 Tax=Desulfobacula sp. TaxID=2593537 RepID=UPI0019919956|nr:transporter substrate-binding domain-containing protein [Candidatus Desulfobacula maris]MBL6994108.1 transporter substrate-binding domain-containing protein [Desulfobacula sp.]
MKNFKLFLLVFGFLLLSVAGSTVAGQQTIERKNITISSIGNEQTHELAKEVVRVAYKKIGFSVEFNDLPARRALEWANSGKTDGDLARIDGTEKKFTNLIKISTPVTEFKGVVFTQKIKKDILSWEDLNGLSVGIIGGIQYSDIGTKGLNRILAKDMSHLFKLLTKDRIDIAVAVLDAGKIEIYRNFKESKIQIIGQPLYSAPLFHYVHKKNKYLVPQLEIALQEMMENGEIESIREKALQEALSK